MKSDKTPHQLIDFIKSYQKRTFWNLVKSYKHYYLGLWIIKLLFYIIFDKKKANKYYEKALLLYKNLQFAKKYFLVFSRLAIQSKEWLQSNKFQMEYADSLYPPLLNPQDLDYESIPTDLAWEMNLPLPKNYDFMYFSNGSQASMTVMLFFKECGVKLGAFDCSAKYMYYEFSNFLLNHKQDKTCFFSYIEYLIDISLQQHSDAEKLLYLFAQKVPLVYVARDPIVVIKGYLNHITYEGFNFAKINKILNLTCNYNKILHTPIYRNNKQMPGFEAFDDNDRFKFVTTLSFMFSSILKILQDKISQIYCIEFNDLRPELGFDTFCKLADKLGIDRPKNDNFIKAKLGAIARGTLTTLPTTIYVHPSDMQNVFKDGVQENQNLDSLKTKNGFNIIVTLPYALDDELPDYLKEGQKDFADITDEIQKNLIIDDTPILIFIKQTDLVQLQKINELWDITKEYLKGYISALQNHAIKIRANLITEEQVLQYFRVNDNARKYAKQQLDNELCYIKEHYPNFIKKWKYYLEFEKMCAELDSTESITNNLNSTDKKEGPD